MAAVQDLLCAFRHFDEDGSGLLSADEFRQVLTNSDGDCPLDQQQFDDIMNYVDSDGDGNVSYTEFVVWLDSVPDMGGANDVEHGSLKEGEEKEEKEEKAEEGAPAVSGRPRVPERGLFTYELRNNTEEDVQFRVGRPGGAMTTKGQGDRKVVVPVDPHADLEETIHSWVLAPGETASYSLDNSNTASLSHYCDTIFGEVFCPQGYDCGGLGKGSYHFGKGGLDDVSGYGDCYISYDNVKDDADAEGWPEMMRGRKMLSDCRWDEVQRRFTGTLHWGHSPLPSSEYDEEGQPGQAEALWLITAVFDEGFGIIESGTCVAIGADSGEPCYTRKFGNQKHDGFMSFKIAGRQPPNPLEVPSFAYHMQVKKTWYTVNEYSTFLHVYQLDGQECFENDDGEPDVAGGNGFVSNPEFYWAYELKKKKLARDREDALEYTDATHIKRSAINNLHNFFMDGRSVGIKGGLCDDGAGGECLSDDGAGDDDGFTSGSESEDGGEEVADPVELFYLYVQKNYSCRASGRLNVYELSDDMLMGITVPLWPFARDLYDAAFDLVSMDENNTVCTDELVKAMQANSSFRVVHQVKLKMYESRKRMAESATGGLSVYHV